MKQLIVNADDMGASEAINTGIIQAHTEGIVTATSLMANGAAYNHAIELCRATLTLDCGVHLTVVDGTPLSTKDEVISLLDTNGCFYPNAFTFTHHYLRGHIRLDQVEHEFAAQIQRLVDDGIALTHIDSHQHLHLLPGIHAIVRKLAKQFSIPWIRRPSESFIPLLRSQQPIHWLRLMQQWALSALSSFSPSFTPGGCYHFRGFYDGGNLTLSALQLILQQLPSNSVTELMCHPGLENSDEHGGITYHRAIELSALTAASSLIAMDDLDIQLIGFGDL
ncbi:MAG: ChbG/HpnK family deacetylase [Mariprofundales bacterium]